MRLGIDADPVGRNLSGNEVYLRGLIGGLQEVREPEDSIVLVGSRAAALREIAGTGTKVIQTHRGLAGDLLLGHVLNQAGVTAALASYNAPIAFRGPVATVVHDVSYRRFPETFPWALRTRITWSVRRAVRRSAFIVTCSEFSRQELIASYPELDRRQVVVALPAPGPEFSAPPDHEADQRVLRRHHLPSQFVLSVGNLQPRKNLGRLVAATRLLGVPLVAVGQPLWRQNDVVQALSEPHVLSLGHLPVVDLVALYRRCTVFVYPSLYEGFGLPVVEAMAAGAPVVTSSVSALPEAAGGAAVLVDPESVDGIAAGVQAVLSSDDLRQSLVQRGLRRVTQLSWPASATGLVGALRSLT